MEDKAGNIWFGTNNGGVSCFNGESFTNYAVEQGLVSKTIFSIIQDKQGNIWFGSVGGGVSRYDANHFNYPCNTKKCKHNLLVPNELEKHNKELAKSFTNYTTAQGLLNNWVLCMSQDKNENIWLGAYGNGVCRYNAKWAKSPCNSKSCKHDLFAPKDIKEHNKELAKSFTYFSTAQGLASNLVVGVVEDKVGNIWLSTEGGGVSCYDGKSFTSFSSAQGLVNNNIKTITEDNAGNIWFGSFSNGISRYNGKAFINYTTSQGLANNIVRNIIEDNHGNLWFATAGGGASCYDGKSFTNYNINQGLADNQLFSLFKDRKGNLWFGSNVGFSRYDDKYFTNFSTLQGLSSNQILCILEDKNGNLWFGTNGNGVCRYDGKSFLNYTTSQGLANNIVCSMAEDKFGNLWFGTNGGGVSSFNGKAFINFTKKQGLATNYTTCIAADKLGNLWIGTEEGLCLMKSEQIKNLVALSIKKDGISQPFFKVFKKDDGLSEINIFQLLELQNGNMAAGTTKGFFLFKPSKDCAKVNEIISFTANKDYPVKDINLGQNSIFQDSKGIIWFGTGSDKTALVRFDPSALPMNINPPKMLLKSVKINEETICWYDLFDSTLMEKKDSLTTYAYITEEINAFGRVLSERERDSMRQRFNTISFNGRTRFYPIPEDLVLPYKFNRITIEFNAIETGKPNLINYQYMLEGYDKDWSPVLNQTSATFGNISEGIYTFKVKAQGPNGLWSEALTYTFKVLPPWYRTWWAFLIYMLAFLWALRIFSKWRERLLRMEKVKLKLKVEERTETIEKQKKILEEQKEDLVNKNKAVEKQKAIVEREKQRSEALLLNILPEEIAEELKSTGASKAKQFQNVTVLFTDFVNFTQATERLSPQELINELHTCFKKFDEITEKYNIEKIKTIGDAYLAVAGLPTPDPKHAENIVNAAIEIRQFMKERLEDPSNSTFEIRIGIHTGNVIAGIVGVKKFAYDIWGDTVNIAARMEQNSEKGKINISQTTYDLVSGKFECENRGEQEAKGKGQLKMFYVL